MFDALEVCLQYIERVAPLEAKIKKRSPGLAKQLSEANDSAGLNLAEGQRRRGGDQRYHWDVAAGSASEATFALRLALARKYITAEELAYVDEPLDRVRAMLYRMTH
jgi:four helix bundle protein